MKISKAIIFDIKRFAIHDGDGIRTTIFFKGCPLKCQWCQNPEGISLKRRPLYFKKKCIHCRYCEKYADHQEIIYKDRPYFRKDYQGSYQHIIDICPSGAIIYDSQEYDVKEIMEMIIEDIVFYRENGGVTFSGGEPLLQKDVLYELLKQCQKENIHTAIETSLYAPLEEIKPLLPYLNQIYIDLKVFDERKHQEYTGVSSKRIKENIKYILSSEHKNKVIMRTPLIPTKTATKQNIKEIATYLYQCYPYVKYELLNYNPLASSKYEFVDLSYGIDKTYKPYTNEEMDEFYQILKDVGIKNVIRE